MERFGWTFDELDAQDEGRAIRGIGMINMLDSFKRILNAVESHQLEMLTLDDWKIYKMFSEAQFEIEEDNG